MKWIALFIAVTCLTVSCSTAPKNPSTGVPLEVKLAPDLCESSLLPKGESPPAVASIEPNRASQAGGVSLLVNGEGFMAGSRILIGGRDCLDLNVQSPELISCTAPVSDEEGPVNVLLINPGRRCAAVRDAFEYLSWLRIDPRAKAVTVGTKLSLRAIGGTPPYKFTLYSGDGTLDGTTGEFRAPTTPSSSVVRVTDADGAFDDSVIVSQPALSIALAPQQGDPSSYEFTVRGGTPPIQYSLDSGQEAADETGNSIGTAVLTVSDASGASESLRLKINREVPLTAFPQARAIGTGGKTRVVAAGGKGELSFSLISGGGTIDPKTGEFVAPSISGDSTIHVTDSQGSSMDVVIHTEERLHGAILGMLAAGWGHTCWSDGKGIQCWGDNRYGQLGDGTMVRSLVPRSVKGLPSGVVQLVSGYGHVCALLKGGRMKCWGDNRYGQLGDGSLINSPTPVQVTGLTGGVQSITAGQYHTCAVLRGGAVRCWGSNRRGQLGFNSLIPSSLPVSVSGLSKGVKQVAAGAAHTCALLESGDVSCWGYNNSGQLGDGTQADRLIPTPVKGGVSGVAQLALGGFHSCARLESGGVKCWGNNGLGQLGNGGFQNALLPIDVKLSSSAQELVAGFYHSCAKLDSGALWCWGYNQDGQLGVGSESRRIPSPVSVKGLSTEILSIATGVDHTCVLVQEGVRCWGSNAEGQFGNRVRDSLKIPGRAVQVQSISLQSKSVQ